MNFPGRLEEWSKKQTRTFFKQIYRYTRPRNMRHMENFWPFLGIDTSENNALNITWRGNTICRCLPLQEIKNSIPGKWFLIANGPSVGDIDLQLLDGQQLCGVNGAIALNRKRALNFSCYAIIDPVFVEKHFELVREAFNSETLCFLTLYSLIYVYRRDPELLKNSRVCLVEDVNKRIYKPRMDKEEFSEWSTEQKGVVYRSNFDNPAIGFSYDISKGIFDGGTVTFWALQILPFLGATEVNIAGMDIQGVPDKNRFYETTETKQVSDLMDKYHRVIEPGLIIASECYADMKIDLYNLSPISVIPEEIIPKCDVVTAVKR